MSGYDCCILLARLIYYLRIDIIFCYLIIKLFNKNNYDTHN